MRKLWITIISIVLALSLSCSAFASENGNSTSDICGECNVATPVVFDEMSKPLAAAEQHFHLPPTDKWSQLQRHPHEATYYCEKCKKNVVGAIYLSTCSSCKSGSRTAEKTAKKDFTFGYIDGDAGFGVPIFVTVPCSVRYTNNYKKYTEEFRAPMQVFSSQIVATASPAPNFPDMVCVPLRESKYYQNNTLITTEQLQFGGNTSSVHSKTPFYPFPVLKSATRAVGQATFGMVSSTYSHTLQVEIKF